MLFTKNKRNKNKINKLKNRPEFRENKTR